jgi:hypothetical protein
VRKLAVRSHVGGWDLWPMCNVREYCTSDPEAEEVGASGVVRVEASAMIKVVVRLNLCRPAG